MCGCYRWDVAPAQAQAQGGAQTQEGAARKRLRPEINQCQSKEQKETWSVFGGGDTDDTVDADDTGVDTDSDGTDDIDDEFEKTSGSPNIAPICQPMGQLGAAQTEKPAHTPTPGPADKHSTCTTGSCPGLDKDGAESLERDNMLKDSAINCFNAHLCSYARSQGVRAIHESSFWFIKLLRVLDDEHALKNFLDRWSAKAKQKSGLDYHYDADLILVPVHQPLHWVAGLVDTRTMTLTFYDPLAEENGHTSDYTFFRAMTMCLKNSWGGGGWRCVVDDTTPKQPDLFSCGVLVSCYFACRVLMSPIFWVSQPGSMKAARSIVRDAAFSTSAEVFGGGAFAPALVLQSWNTEICPDSKREPLGIRKSEIKQAGRGLFATKEYHDDCYRLAGENGNGLVATVSLPILSGSKAEEYITDALDQRLYDAWIATSPGGGEVIALCTRPKTCPASAGYNPPLLESVVYFMNHAAKTGEGRANMVVNWKRGPDPNFVEVSLRVNQKVKIGDELTWCYGPNVKFPHVAPQQPPTDSNASVGKPPNKVKETRPSKRAKISAAAVMQPGAQIELNPRARKLGGRQSKVERRACALNEVRISSSLRGECDCGSCASKVEALGRGVANKSVAPLF